MERLDDHGRVIVPHVPFIKNGNWWKVDENDRIYVATTPAPGTGSTPEGEIPGPSLYGSEQVATIAPATFKLEISGDAAHLANIPAMLGQSAVMTQRQNIVSNPRTEHYIAPYDNDDLLAANNYFPPTTAEFLHQPPAESDVADVRPIQMVPTEVVRQATMTDRRAERQPRFGKKVPALGFCALFVLGVVVVGSGPLLQAGYDGPLNGEICDANGMHNKFDDPGCPINLFAGEMTNLGNVFHYFPEPDRQKSIEESQK
jgi:hypothetical protein